LAQSAHTALVESVVKDIKSERPCVQELDAIRITSLSAFFLDYFNLVKQTDSGKDKDWSLIACWTEAERIGWLLGRLTNALTEKPANWPEVHAAVNCFTQVVRPLCARAFQTDTASAPRYRAPSAGPLRGKPRRCRRPSAQDVLPHLVLGPFRQSHDKLQGPVPQVSVLALPSDLPDPCLRYLDAVMNLAYVFLRMLEKYSKVNVSMRVSRKKKLAAKRKQSSTFAPR
jgi:replication fork protection complex subunit Tof1/Swi1